MLHLALYLALSATKAKPHKSRLQIPITPSFASQLKHIADPPNIISSSPPLRVRTITNWDTTLTILQIGSPDIPFLILGTYHVTLDALPNKDHASPNILNLRGNPWKLLDLTVSSHPKSHSVVHAIISIVLE